MEGVELISFQIISAVGTARSCYIEAIQASRRGDFIRANELLEEGRSVFTEGHHTHAKLIQMEANGEMPEFSLLLMHAEDQMMSAETFGVLAEEFIELYKTVKS
ncbi:MAG: PTS lactose/cellobiose transporter subunit IIA [Erysipelotrichia bacterium]|nr:PTS lactose/cellobiose transporter subunit IIA [Erysipelotrichia bacterium]